MIELFVFMLTAVLVENFIFSRFMGICPFMGVSEKPDTAIGMGFAVMENFMDRLVVRSRPGKGTVVIMTKRIGSDPATKE